jgi:putative ABC transport system permease protein
MRWLDLLALPLHALIHRPCRSLLTTLGVTIGCFVLLTSLSIGIGVNEVILAQLRKQDQLRRIIVWPGGGPRAETVPQEQLEIAGTMSEERRERLREGAKRRWKTPPPKPGQLLAPKVLAQIAEIEHVEAVVPGLFFNGRLTLTQSHDGAIRTAGPEDHGIARRLIAGRGVVAEERSVLLSEYAAYRCGVRDEGEVAGLIGKTIRVEILQAEPGISNLLYLLNLGRPDLSDEEKRVLKKVLPELPKAISRMNLPVEDQATLAKILAPARPAQQKLERKLPIVGIFRDVTRTELGPFDGPPRPVDLLLSPRIAEELHNATPGRQGVGLPQANVRIDHEDHLRSVQKQIEALGVETFSLAELADQIQLNVLLISTACTFVAIIALIVSALGITNTMLMSVLERTHEIGVMKATGARDRDISTLFLIEGVIVGVIGAMFGVVFAWLISFPGDAVAQHLVSSRTPMQLDGSVFAFPWWVMLGVPALVVGLTTLAAVGPARRAAKIDPIAALRQG